MKKEIIFLLPSFIMSLFQRDSKNYDRYEIKTHSEYDFYNDRMIYRIDFIDTKNKDKYPDLLDRFVLFFSQYKENELFDFDYFVNAPNRNYSKRMEIPRKPLSQGRLTKKVRDEILEEFDKFLNTNERKNNGLEQ